MMMNYITYSQQREIFSRKTIISPPYIIVTGIPVASTTATH
jgi:hypothetical protein